MKTVHFQNEQKCINSNGELSSDHQPPALSPGPDDDGMTTHAPVAEHCAMVTSPSSSSVSPAMSIASAPVSSSSASSAAHSMEDSSSNQTATENQACQHLGLAPVENIIKFINGDDDQEKQKSSTKAAKRARQKQRKVSNTHVQCAVRVMFHRGVLSGSYVKLMKGSGCLWGIACNHKLYELFLGESLCRIFAMFIHLH